MAGPTVALNGRRVTSAKVVIPYYGTWSADVILAQTDAIQSVSTLVIGDLSLSGAIYRMASFSGSRSARIIGGFGGWRKQLPAQGYQDPNGIRLSLILGDAAAIVGEQVRISEDRMVGTSFVREAAPAQRLLRQFAGATWWVDNSGITQIGPRTSSTISSAFTVVNWSGAKGAFEIATERVADWMPARTFSSPTVTTTQTIGMTTITVNNEGKLRVSVLSAGAESS